MCVKDGSTALVVASLNGYTDTVNTLLAAHADPNILTNVSVS